MFRNRVFIISFAIACTFQVNHANAKRISVGLNLGTDLTQACLLEDDARDVATTNGNYTGCCSKSLGYCVLCEKSGTGKCYKFTSARSLLRFQRHQLIAPGSNKVADEEPRKPFTPPAKATPAGNLLIK